MAKSNDPWMIPQPPRSSPDGGAAGSPPPFVPSATSPPVVDPAAPSGPQPPVFTPTDQPSSRQPSRRPYVIIAAVVLVIVVVTVGGALLIASITTDKVGDAIKAIGETPAQELSDTDRTALGLTGGELNGFDGEAPAKLAAALDLAAPGEPTRFTSMSFYPDYALAIAVNPVAPDHLDEYEWRDGAPKQPSPQPNDEEAADHACAVSDVDWPRVATAMVDIVRVAGVEDGAVGHVIITRSTTAPEQPVVVRVYVNGPRASSVVELSAEGELIRTF
jgi:hypothetical protein